MYGEIGPGQRIAVSKLAVEHFEKTGRPLRLAIDVSIWQFQVQAGQGGSNPILRTLYYRLVRLLSLAIQPLFVFDGPHKPPFKRGKKTTPAGGSARNHDVKQLLDLFGFAHHMAPGEAEAECALLQRKGVVDAVLSEDVDTLMFGCTRFLRNWSSDSSRGSAAPTHVSLYEHEAMKRSKAGLDRQGMILIALMSGGDYIPEGIPGCGIKLACEAARAGFGSSLCTLIRSTEADIEAWRDNLSHELQTNESGFFRTKHKALKIPRDFPNMEVLKYYTNPVVSSETKLEQLRESIDWEHQLDVQGLRDFCRDVFDWTHKVGAIKFIRGLAPALLVTRLLARSNRRDSGYGDVVLTEIDEMTLVRAIHSKRTHFSSDGIPELRLIFQPLDIVPLSLEDEPDDTEDRGRDGLALEDEEGQILPLEDAEPVNRAESPTKRTPSAYDPNNPDKVWVPETIVKVGVPLKVQDYEEALRNPRKHIKQKAAAAKAATIKGGMPRGAMDKFVRVTKPTTTISKNDIELRVSDVFSDEQIHSAAKAIGQSSSKNATRTTSSKNPQTIVSSPATRATQPNRHTRDSQTVKVKPANPWAASQTTSSRSSPVRTTKPSAKAKVRKDCEASSSPQASHASQKHTRGPSPPMSTAESTLSSPKLDSTLPSPNKKRLHQKVNRVLEPAQSDTLCSSESTRLSPAKDSSPSSTYVHSRGPAVDDGDHDLPALQTLLKPVIEIPKSRSPGRSPPPEVIDLSSSPSLSAISYIISSQVSQAGAQAETRLLNDMPPSSPSVDSESPTKHKSKTKKLLIMRQSLPGTFKEADDEEYDDMVKRMGQRAHTARVLRLSSVECVDLTGD